MGDKLYSGGPNYPQVNNIYNRASCAKDTNQQQYYSYPVMQTGNSFSQNQLLEGYNTINSQSCPKNMYSCSQTEFPNWDGRLYEEALKIPDKIEMIEITSKDLSPASFCSNMDLLLPDFYKGGNYYNNAQWFNSGSTSNQKLAEFPSCAQINQANVGTDSVKYCSIQKTQDFNSYNYISGSSENMYCDQSRMQAADLVAPENFPYSYYENFDLPNVTGIDQQTECSNDESDIIVEESDGDTITQTNEFDKRKLPSYTNKCIICNVKYTPLGTQFYHLTLKSPLTMSTQRPVFSKIASVVGTLKNKVNYLCSECLGLINTIDHLKMKLDSFNAELLGKFEKTSADNKEEALFPHKKKKRKFIHSYTEKLKRYRCKLCKKMLCLKDYCRSHLRWHKFRGLLCEICGEISRNKASFFAHYEKRHKKLSISPFSCNNCPKSFRTNSNLKSHRNFCLGLLPFPCKFCYKKFPTSTQLKNHTKLKHDKKFIAICSICNIGFVKLCDYKAHKTSHSTDKRFTCKICDKSYKTLSNLNFHIKVHNNKMPFICEVCGKGFMRKEYLEAHDNNHKGIKNFACSICEKKFVSQKNLDSHLKYHDGAAKTKECNICGKVMSSGFEEHLRIHNNLREFECDQCDFRFNTKGTLAKHKKRKHAV